MMGMIRNVTTKQVNIYKIARTLWKGVGIPRSTYGYEVCRVSGTELQRMEVIQNKVARLGLGANKFVATEALRGEMAWSTYKDRIYRMKANYKAKLIHRGPSSWPGYIYRDQGRSAWRADLRRIERRYNIQNVYAEENCLILIKNAVIAKAQEEWESGIAGKSSLSLYKLKKRPKVEEIYDGTWGSALLFAARTGSLKTNLRTRFWNEVGSICQWCEGDYEESLNHMFVECNGHRIEREQLISGVINKIGLTGLEKLMEDDQQGLGYLLGFKGEVDLTDLSKTYLKKIFIKRGQ